MDLWIKTQDGLSLMKIDNIFLYNSLKGNIATITSGRGILKLAEYKTNERALEVLSEIQNILKNEKNSIYELPKE